MRPITWEEKVEARGIERGLERGIERGLERGIESGLARGEAKGMRTVLLRLLEKRFSTLPSRAIERIQSISSTEELGALAERLLTARSLEELGLA